MAQDRDGMSETEYWTRFSSNLAGGIFGGVLGAFGAGAAVAPIQEAKGIALDAAFPKINPQRRINETIRKQDPNVPIVTDPNRTSFFNPPK